MRTQSLAEMPRQHLEHLAPKLLCRNKPSLVQFTVFHTKIHPVVFVVPKYAVYCQMLCLYRALLYSCYNANPPKCYVYTVHCSTVVIMLIHPMLCYVYTVHCSTVAIMLIHPMLCYVYTVHCCTVVIMLIHPNVMLCLYRALLYSCYNANPPKCYVMLCLYRALLYSCYNANPPKCYVMLCLYRALLYSCYNANPPKCTRDTMLLLFL